MNATQLPPCAVSSRLKAVREGMTALSGIDYVEAIGAPSSTLKVHFFGKHAGSLKPDQFVVTLSRRNLVITPESLTQCEDGAECWILKFKSVAEQTPYRLRLIKVDEHGCRTNDAPDGFDPRFSTIDFEFSPGQSTDTDFDPAPPPSSPTLPEPAINYLAKDYQSFRQLILDRLSVIMPNWRERHEADLGMTLVELLAYTGDRLSYFQDAVATEAYLGTARRRISLRRHARLVDYRIHEGCNARTFLHLRCETPGGMGFAPQDVFFTTKFPETYQLTSPVLREDQLPEDYQSLVEVFEPLLPPPLSPLITCQDIKDRCEVVRAMKELEKQGPAILGEPLHRKLGTTLSRLGSDQFSPAWDAPADSIIRELCEILNELIEDQNLWRGPAMGKCCPNTRNEVSRLLAEKKPAATNRLILEQLLGGALSSSRQDQRIKLYPQHNEIPIYRWDECEYWLPKGATSATLWDQTPTDPEERTMEDAHSYEGGAFTPEPSRRLQNLSRGDFLLFEEVAGPRTGQKADADPNHRQVVRLTRVRHSEDPVGKRQIVEIEWALEDALKFPLCVRSRRGPQAADRPCEYVSNVSVARGNIVLADHGLTLAYRDLGAVETESRQVSCATDCEPPRIVTELIPYEPQLTDADLTFSQELEQEKAAAELLIQKPYNATPEIVLRAIPATAAGETLPLKPEDFDPTDPAKFERRFRELSADRFRYVLEDIVEPAYAAALANRLTSKIDGCVKKQIVHQLQERTTWVPRYDLIQSDSTDRHFVVEMDDERVAHLRFGDGQLGHELRAGTRFHAQYRVGNGRAGNVGSNQIAKLVYRRNLQFGVTAIRNPLPAEGGTDPQTLTEIRLQAPITYQRQQLRAVIAQDYVDLVLREFRDSVQDAKASLSWAGTCWLVQIAIDPFNSVFESTEPSPDKALNALKDRITKWLEGYRRIGHRVEVVEGIQVPIELSLVVCVKSGVARSDVRRELMNLFSNRELPNGTRGLFNGDNLTFGQPIYTSQLIEAASRIDGVENVDVTLLQRFEQPDTNAFESGILEFDGLEIAVLDNSQSGPTTGRFCLELRGGR